MNMIKQYLFAIVAALLLMLIIPLGIDNLQQHKQVKTLTTHNTELVADSALTKLQLGVLTASVDKQNQKVTEFESKSLQMADARIKAQKEADQQIKQLSDQIARLERERAAGCTADGIRNKILREVMQ